VSGRFTHNIVLRAAQVELVREFVDAVRSGRPLVKQMLMGGGKTTVVGPLLALMLADGKSLVLQTMPPALLEQSKATLRATFSSIVRKRGAHAVPNPNPARSSLTLTLVAHSLHARLRPLLRARLGHR